MKSSIPAAHSRCPQVLTMFRVLCFLMLVAAVTLTGCASAPPPSEPHIKDVIQTASVTVYPPMCWRGTRTYDHASAKTLADFVQKRTTGAVTVSSQEIRGSNPKYSEIRPRYDIVCDSIIDHVTNHPMATDYGLWAVYVFVPGTQQSVVQEIQVELFDKKGAIVRRFTVDSFDTTLSTAAECTEIVMKTVVEREAIYGSTPR